MSMLYIGFCRVCSAGPVGLRKCGGCGGVVLLCDECDALWTTADLAAKPQFPEQPDLPCPHCGDSLVASPSHWATEAELASPEWLADALRGGVLKLASGEPFGELRDDDPWNKLDVTE